MRDSRCPDYPNECFHPFHAKATSEVPATNDPRCCSVCGVRTEADTPSGWYLWHDENCTGELNEVPADEGTLDRVEKAIAYAFEGEGEAWSDKLSGDRLAYSARRAIESILAAELQKARDEGEVTGRIRAAQSAIGFIQEHPKASATDLDAHLAKVFGEPSREQLDRAAGPS